MNQFNKSWYHAPPRLEGDRLRRFGMAFDLPYSFFFGQACAQTFTDRKKDRIAKHQWVVRHCKPLCAGTWHWCKTLEDGAEETLRITLSRSTAERCVQFVLWPIIPLTTSLFTVRDINGTVSLWCDHLAHASGRGHNECVLDDLIFMGTNEHDFEWIEDADGAHWRIGERHVPVDFSSIDVSNELILLAECVALLFA